MVFYAFPLLMLQSQRRAKQDFQFIAKQQSLRMQTDGSLVTSAPKMDRLYMQLVRHPFRRQTHQQST